MVCAETAPHALDLHMAGVAHASTIAALLILTVERIVDLNLAIVPNHTICSLKTLGPNKNLD